MEGVPRTDPRTRRRPKSAMVDGKEIASWQKLEEDAQSIKEKPKRPVRIMKREPSYRDSKPKVEASSEDPHQKGTVDSEHRQARSTKLQFSEQKTLSVDKHSARARNCSSAVDFISANGRSGNLHSSDHNGHEKSDDLDFTEKVKAFRALINPRSRQNSHDLSNEQLKRARSYSDGIEAVGNHVKFNAESVENKQVWSSTPREQLNEYQLTFDQDKEKRRRRRETILKVSRQFDALESGFDFEQIPNMDCNGVYYGLGGVESRISRSPVQDLQITEQRPTKSPSEIRLVRKTIIKRPNRDRDSGAVGSSKTSETRDIQTRTHSDRLSREDSEIMAYTGHSTVDTDKITSARVSSRSGIIKEPHIRSYSTNTFKSSGREEDRTVSSSVGSHRPIIYERSQSATPLSGKLRMDVTRSISSSRSSLLQSPDLPGRDESLKSHLNILGASLSSLSSKLTSGSETDLRSGMSERSSSTRSLLANGVSTGRTDDLALHGSTLTRMVGLAASQSLASLRDDTSSYHSRAPSCASLVDSKTRENDLSSKMTTNSQRAKQEKIKSKSSSVSSSNVGMSPRSSVSETRKQTNVKDYNGDDTLTRSAADSDDDTLHDVSDFHEHESMVSSDGERTMHDLKRTAKYISRHGSGSEPDIPIHQEFDRAKKGHKNIKSGASVNSVSENNDNEHVVKGEKRSLRKNNIDSSSLSEHASNISKSHSKSSKGRVISRKIPLKAVHPGEHLEHDERRGSNRNSSSPMHTADSPGHDTDSSSNLPMSSSTNVTERLSQKSSIASQERSNAFRESGSRKSDISDTPRSKSSLGVLVSKDIALHSSALPSRTNLSQFKDKSRPHTSLDLIGRGEHGVISSKRVISRKNIRSSTGKEVRSRTEISGRDDKSPSQPQLLINKVQKLHDEIDQRLHSNENLAHNAGKYETDLSLFQNRQGYKQSLEDFETSSITSTIRFGKENSRPSSRPSHRQSDDELFISKKDIIQRSPSVPVTSTPLKEMKQLLREGRLSDDKNVENSSEKSESREFLVRSLKQLISSRDRLTPDFSRSNQQFSRVKDEDGDSDEGIDDSEDIDFTDKDTSFQRNRHRSGSIGVSRGTVSRPSGDKKDIVSRILNKMTTSTPRDSRFPIQSNGFSASFHSGRASPAESLLRHLDNPGMVKLLQMLYKADPETRKVIMIQVQYFKAWQAYTVESRERRLKKEAFTRRADLFCRERLLGFHFLTWEARTSHNRKMRKAAALFRLHMLTKGFKALRWSVSRSKHQSAKLKATVQMIQLKVTFKKWKTRALTQRTERIKTAMARWKQYTQETQKIRHMQAVMNTNLMSETLKIWTKQYTKCVKRNMAFTYFRFLTLRHSVTKWHQFVDQCKEKKEKYFSAVNKHQRSLLCRAFYTMLVSYKKTKKATAHFRHQRLYEVLWAWKQGVQVCRAEKQEELAKSWDYWKQQRLKQSFTAWKERLMICRAQKQSNFKICRNAFILWLAAWRQNIVHREMIQTTLVKNKLHRMLLTWRQNAVQLKRRRRAAVALIEHCHLGHTLKIWRMYALARGTLKKKLLYHQMTYQRKTVSTCFRQWLESYRIRQADEAARQFWSECCARKMAVHWQQLCQKRKLRRLLQHSQPDRENRLLRVMFKHWKTSLGKRIKENQVADEWLKNLQKLTLLRNFNTWKSATGKALKIKPILQRQEQRLSKECFEAWVHYIKDRSRLKQTHSIVHLQRLKKAFCSWRTQFKAHQTEKLISARYTKGLLMCHLEEWHFLIVRKRQSQHFHQSQLTKRMFYLWKEKAEDQLTQRKEMEEEQEWSMNLKRWCFRQWLDTVRTQVVNTEQNLSAFVNSHDETRTCRAFFQWRRLMHSTLIARAYEKTYSQRLLRTLLLEWAKLTKSSVTSAVQKFSERIGLSVAEPDVESYRDSPIFAVADGEEIYHSIDGAFELDGNKMLSSSLNSSYSHSSSIRRLFGEGDRSMDGDVERMVLLSGGLQAAVDDHHIKRQRLKEMVSTAVNRLQHWPTCVAFSQWREFVLQQRQLKSASLEVKTSHERTEVKLAFRKWKEMYLNQRTAKDFWSKQTLSSCLQAWHTYTNHRKYVNHLNRIASLHRMLKVFREHFPYWRQKAHDQKQEKTILHLWSSRTAREMELLPLETQLTTTLRQRSLKMCFSVWHLQYEAVARVRTVYHNSLLTWVFSAWKDWAQWKHELHTKSESFLKTRRTKLVFSQWCERLAQSREVSRKYTAAWRNYQGYILQQWRAWAQRSHQHQLSYKMFVRKSYQQKLKSSFNSWSLLTQKVQALQSNHKQKLLFSVFRGWLKVTRQSKHEKQQVIKFQVQSYTKMVQRLFVHWRDQYFQRLQLRKEKQQQAELVALEMCRKWRRKTQTSRGLRLRQMFEHRRVEKHFAQWQEAYLSVQNLYDTLDTWTQQKNKKIMLQALSTWRLKLTGDRLNREMQGRLVYTVLAEWRSYAKVTKERRIRGLALKKALQERSLHVSFQYWAALTQVKQSVQRNVETRIQLRVFQAWHYHTSNMRYLRELQEHFSRRVNTRILHDAFTNMRWKAEYCTGLSEMAENMVCARQRATMKAVLVVWRDRLDRILAARCYGQFLVLRVSRQWRRFVYKKKVERQRDEDNWNAAVRHHNKTLSKKVMNSLKKEIVVSRMAQKRRQTICNKYALVWKLRVDMSVTALTVEREFLLRQFWHKWRLDYSKRAAANKVTCHHNKFYLAQVFKAWRRVCLPKYNPKSSTPRSVTERRGSATSSLLPVPISQARTTQGSAAELSFGFRPMKR